ncbi:MAG: nitroreductase family protein [Bacteroidales bacterium]
METRKLFNDRRSVNFFDRSKDLDGQLLKDIINTAVLTPSAFNLQPWRIIAVKSAESKEKLYKLANNQQKVLDAPVTLILVGNKNGWDDTNPVWAEMLKSFGGNQQMLDGAKQAAAFLYGSSEERKLKFAESNTGLIAMSIMIAAKDFGVDSHPMSGLDFDGVHKAFGLKDHETVVMAITLGYHDEKQTLYPRNPRKQFDDIATVV